MSKKSIEHEGSYLYIRRMAHNALPQAPKALQALDRAACSALYHCDSQEIKPKGLQSCGPFKTAYEAVQFTGLSLEECRKKFKDWKPSKGIKEIRTPDMSEYYA